MGRREMRIALVSCLASALAAAFVPSAVPQDQPLPADNGWIAFGSDRSGQVGSGVFRLYRLDVVGGHVAELGLTGRQPSWSPDGSLLAIVQNEVELVIARPDGTRVKVLVSRYPLSDPSWSPDGSRIVVTQALGGRYGSDLAVVDVTRATFARITRSPSDDTEPSWSPDGRWIAFASGNRAADGEDGEIYLVTPDGRGVRRLIANEFDDRSPAWSPDGTRLAFVRSSVPEGGYPELWTMTSDGRSAVRVHPDSGRGGLRRWSDTSPSWSPDGRWLVYVTDQLWHLVDVFIVEVDGDAKFNLTPGSQSYDIEPAWQPVCSVPGTGRRDVLRGTELDELVCGLGGSDTVSGGAGSDRLFGGFGNDRIRARDGEFDVVGCGAGRDSVVADRRDLVGTDCEDVRRR
jgi:Tol biopolymer transport system component